MRAGRRVLVVAGLVVVAAVATAVAVGATWGSAIEVPGTATLNVKGAEVSSVSCAKAGFCTAGGEYVEASGGPLRHRRRAGVRGGREERGLGNRDQGAGPGGPQHGRRCPAVPDLVPESRYVCCGRLLPHRRWVRRRSRVPAEREERRLGEGDEGAGRSGLQRRLQRCKRGLVRQGRLLHGRRRLRRLAWVLPRVRRDRDERGLAQGVQLPQEHGGGLDLLLDRGGFCTIGGSYDGGRKCPCQAVRS